jgi:Ca-activated chloride channel family protein
VLILLTDGANTSGEVQPLQATEFAAREGLRIYTVGVGADEMTVQDFFGSRLVNPSADLDEDTLKAIAERTGGAYFRARDVEALARIYRNWTNWSRWKATRRRSGRWLNCSTGRWPWRSRWRRRC